MAFSKILTPLAILAALFAVILLGPIKGGVVLVGLIMAVFIINQPILMLVGYLAVTSVLPMLEMYGVPFVGYLDELFILIMALYLAVKLAVQKAVAPELGRFYLLTLIMLLEIAVSFIVNRPAPISAIHFILTYMRHVPIFIFVYLYMRDQKFAQRLLKAYLGFLLLQFTLSITWLMGINPLPNNRGNLDKAIGTLGSCSYVAYYAIGMLAVLLSWLRTTKRQLSIAPYFWSMLAFLMAVITLTMHAYFLLIAIVFWWIICELRKKGITMSIVVLSMLLVFLVMGFVTYTNSGRVLLENNLISTDYITMKYRRMMQEPKAIVYNNVLKVARKDLKIPALGGGPGNFASIVAINNQTPLAVRYVSYMFTSSYSARLLRTGSFTVYPYAGFLSIYGDLGIIGFLLYYGMFFYALIRVYRHLWHNVYSEKWQLIVAQAVIPVVGMWMILSLVWDVFTLHFLNASVWMLVALAWSPVDSDTGANGDQKEDSE